MKRKIIENRNKILQLILFVIFGAVLLAGCTDDAFESKRGGPVNQTGVPEGYVRARVNMIASGFEVVKTKSLTNQEEHEWSHVVVGQFDDTGKLVGTVKQYEYDGVSGYFNLILKTSDGAENLIYFITNYGEFNGDMNDPKNNPFINAKGVLVEDLNEFKTQVYAPGGVDNASIANGDQLVMVGSINMVVDKESTPIDNILVYVDKLTAKLDVLIRASQSISTSGHPFIGATLFITGLEIVNVPTRSAFAVDPGRIATQDNLSSFKAELKDNGGSLVKSYSTSKSYYILENIMHGDTESLVPTSTPERGEQYKNIAASDHLIDKLATYLLIEGEMNDGRNVGKVTWKIYLGENNTDNFNVKRNTHYTVTVQIDGAGIATSDIRANTDELSVRELRYLNGKPASQRSPETSYLGPTDSNWGGLQPTANVDTTTYLYIDAGKNGTWGFELTGMNNNALPNWPGLSVSYLPLKEGWDPGTNAKMNPDEIRSKWEDDSEWITVEGLSATGLPSGARVRINVGENNIPAQRTLDFNYFNDNVKEQRRVWRITQYATDKVTILDNNFFPSNAGTYGVMVRAKESSYWRLEKVNSTDLTFKNVVAFNGTTQSVVGEGYVHGHGTIIFDVPEYAGVPRKRMSISVRTYDGNPDDSDPSKYADKTVYINQMASESNLYATKSLTSGKYVYDYSTNPLFETMFAFEIGMPMGINLVEEGMDYEKDESLYRASSTTNGKENTYNIFKKLEGYIAEKMDFPVQGMTAPPVFSPAGLCMMMNENWWEIDRPDHPNLKWYLPARYQGLMGATAVMLGVKGIGHTARGAFWTSTAPQTTPGTVQSSVYFAGTTVDVSSNYSSSSFVRCIRDADPNEMTYPYVANVSNNPIIVSAETVNGVNKGFVNVNPADEGAYSYYRLGLPRRFTSNTQVTDPSGRGPSDPNWSYLSPKFRVAKQDAVIHGASLQGNWVQGSGWSNANAVDIASPATGCAAYGEEGSPSGWRLPSELEMRLILLLGGGIGSGEDTNAKVPVLQKNGKSLRDIPGFVPLGGNQTSGQMYWVNRKYPNDNRAVYLRASDTWSNAISGTANDWNTTNVYVRCVRDM